jgi:hypothetical protein
MNQNQQIITQPPPFEELIIQKNGFGSYCVSIKDRIIIYPTWEELVKSHPFLEDKKREEIKKTREKDTNPRKERTILFCCQCGNSFLWPMDTDYVPSFCDKKCEFEFNEMLQSGKNM